MITKSTRPHCLCCPLVVRDDDQPGDEAGLEDVADPKHVPMEEPIIGMENVTWEHGRSAGARPVKPLPSPKTTSESETNPQSHPPTL